MLAQGYIPASLQMWFGIDRTNSCHNVQYDARDKFLPGVVGGRTASESVAIAASVSGESGAKAKRITTDSREKLWLIAQAVVSGDAIKKALSC